MSDRQENSTQDLVHSDQRKLNLKRKFKPHESAIQVGLFACGLLSIFTTLGIILVLGNESVAFFTRDQWVNSNRPILIDMDEETTIFAVEPGKALESVQESGIIRVGQEIMDVLEFQNNQFDIAVVGTGGGFKRFCALGCRTCGAWSAAPANRQCQPPDKVRAKSTAAARQASTR